MHISVMIFDIGYITGVYFYQVSVGAHIYPQNPVIHTGYLLNFSIAGKMSNQIYMIKAF